MAAADAGADTEVINIPITDRDQTMFDPQQEYMDYEFLKALQRGDKRTVERFLSQEVPAAIDITDADDNVADQAGRRSWRGVTIGGNSALHIAADFRHLELAELICERDSSLLRACNAAGETPLHCAARAGADQIVSHFISEPGRREVAGLRVTDLKGKTALYAAAEEGHDKVVESLLSKDPELAGIVDYNGVSPLYAAVLSKSLKVVQKLVEVLGDGGDTPETSYAGPNGQTALHAAAMIGNRGITNILLWWKPTLTKKVDSSGSTPLHYLAAYTTGNHHMMRELLEHDTSPAYFSDSNGLCPIHVAARMGQRVSIIRELINSCPDMSELVDGGGRNFLHVAIQHESEEIVRFVCSQPLLSKMMNARDSEGNTPLHLAVKSKNQTMVGLLLENMSVHPSIVNENGKTPLDLAKANIDLRTLRLVQFFFLKPGLWIYGCLMFIGAIHCPLRLDEVIQDENTAHQPDQENKQEHESAAQNLTIASVLIATVTFAAAFTMPGGYKADDHRNAGTPTLAGKYAFHAFIISDSLAFVCSIMATISLTYFSSFTADPSVRFGLILRASFFLSIAIDCMMVAFATSVYVVLAPVSTPIAILVCISSFALIPLSWIPHIWQLYRQARVVRSRLGWRSLSFSIFLLILVVPWFYIKMLFHYLF